MWNQELSKGSIDLRLAIRIWFLNFTPIIRAKWILHYWCMWRRRSFKALYSIKTRIRNSTWLMFWMRHSRNITLNLYSLVNVGIYWLSLWMIPIRWGKLWLKLHRIGWITRVDKRSKRRIIFGSSFHLKLWNKWLKEVLTRSKDLGIINFNMSLNSLRKRFGLGLEITLPYAINLCRLMETVQLKRRKTKVLSKRKQEFFKKGPKIS